MEIRTSYTCPLEIVHDIIKGKWKTIILFQLKYGNTTLTKLEHDIMGINQKMLLQQLKELQEFGLVGKQSFEGYPLHVEYFLTPDKGRKILQAIDIMQEIGIQYMVEQGMTEVLDQKGISYTKYLSDTHK
ncbi:helix-turn-helix domain-containing protein [Anaerocolumna sp. AGMB13020]|uniref:winged helix-turn-helix transcriptional regulator n=1 Tax=Anaerocolumna sp. AGMB13020 TaxID=3081750 RepID=UPI002953DA17|nr:helix-turn-helix domain-containing protein [Anaerocolumna sp. AGMB13020]WOO35956.1 helix-turn-helix domain-containing protein [Anaerocolumna sp. AGMB13020]